MGEFITKYWVEFLFTTMVAIVTFLLRNHVKLLTKTLSEERKKDHETTVKEVSELIKKKDEESIAADKQITTRIESLEQSVADMKKGLLSLQGRNFKQDCRNLLQPDVIITLDDYEVIAYEHNIYNSLGGNHEGDKLFDMVEQKYKMNLVVK